MRIVRREKEKERERDKENQRNDYILGENV